MPATQPAHHIVLVASGTSMDVLHRIYRIKDLPSEIIIIEKTSREQQQVSRDHGIVLQIIPQDLCFANPVIVLKPVRKLIYDSVILVIFARCTDPFCQERIHSTLRPP